MVKSITLIAVLASSFTAVYTAPSPVVVGRAPIPSGAAGVTFVPEAAPGCEMSENPFSTLVPSVYNLTSSTGCITPPYAFESYVETANAIAADGPCALSIFSGPDCTGTVVAGTLTIFTDCIVGSNAGGQSVSFACGP